MRWVREMAGELVEADRERVQQLLQHSDLQGVFFHEQSARRHDTAPDAADAERSNVEVGIQFRLATDNFGVRVMAQIQNMVGIATVAASAEYTLADGYEPTKRDVMMFANEVAVMMIFPYLREGISDATTKVFGEPVFLPIAPRGAIGFDIGAEADG